MSKIKTNDYYTTINCKLHKILKHHYLTLTDTNIPYTKRSHYVADCGQTESLS